MPMRFNEQYRYRANQMPARFYLGPRVIDDISGMQFYQAYATEVEEFGDIVDTRRNNYDFDAEAEIGVYDRPGDTDNGPLIGTTGGATTPPINPDAAVDDSWYAPVL